MDIQRAKKLLTILADGIDPLTGEVLPDDHVCNKGEIVRALNCLLAEGSAKRKKNRPNNAGKPWTKEMDAELCRLFDEGIKRKELCARFERSFGAIDARLTKLGKI